MEEKKGIYIAGRLSKNRDGSTADAVDYLLNVSKMMETAQQVKEAGYSVLVPAIDLLMGIKFGYKTYDDYFNNNLLWVGKSDAVYLVPGWEASPGTFREVNHAIENNVPVFDRLDDMWDYFHDIKGGCIVKLIPKEGGNLAVKYREAYPDRYQKEMKELDKKLSKHVNTNN
jgi:hypothetical protein